MRSTVLAAACLLTALPLLAIWTPVGQPVPVDRVLKNLQTQLHDHPDDAAKWVVLGRVHSYAFFVGSSHVPMRGDELYFSHLPQAPKPQEVTADNLEHLKQSIAALRKAIALDANMPLPYLSLGWDFEQGAPYAARIDGASTTSAQWLDRALENYRHAFDHSAKRELDMKSFMPNYQAISQEAAQRIVAIQQQRKDDPAARAEIAKLEPTIKKLRTTPRAITPVIFSFRENTRLRDLLDPNVHVTFDLDGLGDSTWSWLQPSTGILVWDPEHTGKIQSGLQLFGNATWWMFWQDGFQPLAALDDNHDGWLSGAELAGIAVWIDRNQNGKSDPGEVISLEAAGIVRISVHPSLDKNGTLFTPTGIEFADGRVTPAFDWVVLCDRLQSVHRTPDPSRLTPSSM